MTNFAAQAKKRRLDADFVDLNNLEIIDKFGWTVIGVFDPDGADPQFCYTMGARQATEGRCPELAIVGLDGRQAGMILNATVELAREGKVIGPGFNDDILGGGYLAYLGEVRSEEVPERFPRGRWFAHHFEPGAPFRILQVVWPDKTKRFLWDHDAGSADAAGFAKQQPLLCVAPVLPPRT